MRHNLAFRFTYLFIIILEKKYLGPKHPGFEF